MFKSFSETSIIYIIYIFYLILVSHFLLTFLPKIPIFLD